MASISADALRALLVGLALVLSPGGAVRADPVSDGIICREECGASGSCMSVCMKDRERLSAPETLQPMRPMPPAPTLYSAIALDPTNLAVGSSRGYPARTDAERRAVAICRRAGGSAPGCRVLVSRNNACLALATSREGPGKRNIWGYAWSDDGWVSRRNALRYCQKDGGARCAVAASVCSG